MDPQPVSPPAPVVLAPTPIAWRVGIAAGVVALAGGAYLLHLGGQIGPAGQAAFGVVCFLGVAAMCSANLRAVNLRTLVTGFALQLLLVLFVTKFEVGGIKPGRWLFEQAGTVAAKFLEFSNAGAQFVFGPLAAPQYFAFSVLPTIIFVSSFFTVLYYFGILPFIVRVMAKIMVWVMGTSGAETLSVSANVFMGQTEAPLIVKPYIARMTQSELLALMIGGMAHISGSLMAVYIGMVGGTDPEMRQRAAAAILATSVMAAPASLYIAKLILPEMEQPETRGEVKAVLERTHANVVDAAAAGASEGMHLAINVAAMLIAFIALLYMVNSILQSFNPDWSLQKIFSTLFAPVAFLMGVEVQDVPTIANLLGQKLVLNEFVAYTALKDEYLGTISPRSVTLATYALTGFANFSSIGIQLGGIGAMAPNRRKDLARLSGRALLAGFLVTLINAALAGILI